MESFIGIVQSTFTIKILLLILGGSAFGMIVGAIPGLNTTLAVAIVIPLTFYLEPVEALALLTAVYKSGIYGGSISAVLLGVPGTPAAACTVRDGFAMAKNGQAKKALEAALYSSVFADVVSNTILILVASWLAQFALKFGPAENMLLVLFALIVVSLVGSSSLLKGLLASIIGLSLAMLGMDPMTGTPRFTFGNINMLSGVTLIPTLVGMFAISEILVEYSDFCHSKKDGGSVDIPQDRKSHLSMKEFFSYWRTLIRSSLIGVFIGALPGSGASTASFISYSMAQRSSKHPEEFGEGSVEAICASESGNNGVCGATLIPLLTLGIPGDTITAIMYGALILQGITPGPLVFTQQGDMITGLYITLFICSIFMLVLGKIMSSAMTNVLNVPKGILFPIIMIICFAGSYSMNNTMYDILIMIIAGVFGYAYKRINMPIAPTLIGFILGTQMERSLLQSLIKGGNKLSIFVGSPISIAFLVIIAIMFGSQIWKLVKAGKKVKT
jgi:putative tricarboxylic transport membrane protein